MATPLSYSFARPLLLSVSQHFVSHGVYHGYADVGMIEGTLHSPYIPICTPQRPHRVAFAGAVRANVLRQPARDGRAFNIAPHCLSSAVPPPIARGRKRPDRRHPTRRRLPYIPPHVLRYILRCIGGNRINELLRQPNMAAFTSFSLSYPALCPQRKREAQHIRHP